MDIAWNAETGRFELRHEAEAIPLTTAEIRQMAGMSAPDLRRFLEAELGERIALSSRRVIFRWLGDASIDWSGLPGALAWARAEV